MEESFLDSTNGNASENDSKDEVQEDQSRGEFASHAELDAGTPSDGETEKTGVTEGIQSLLAEMSLLRQDFDTKVKYDDSKETLITSLHKELQFYRDGLHFRILKPVFTDLISLYNDMNTLIDSLQQDASDTRQARHLALFQGTVEEILQRNGVDLFRNEQEAFLPSKQRVLRTIMTSEKEKDKLIARRVRPGFEYEGKLLQHELVEIYKYVSEE